MNFKVGDWVKCTDPTSCYYGTVAYLDDEDTQDNTFWCQFEGKGKPSMWMSIPEESWVLTPAPGMKTKPKKETFTAPDILRKAEEIMRERGKQYDQAGGERSMEKIVNTFNAATGHTLTEAQGWMFMIFLKLVRDNSRTEGHQDSCEDLVAYSSLYGESRLS